MFNNSPTFLLGDLSSKTQFGVVRNPNGHKLFKFTSELSMIVSSPPRPTFYRSGMIPDILDRTLISNFQKTLYHKVLNEFDSDYILVLTTLSIQAEKIKPIPKLINKPIKQEVFKQKIDQILKTNRRYTNRDDINSGITHLTESIKTAIDTALAPELNSLF